MGILTAGLAHELRNPANGIVNAIARSPTCCRASWSRPTPGSAS